MEAFTTDGARDVTQALAVALNGGALAAPPSETRAHCQLSSSPPLELQSLPRCNQPI